MSVGILIFEFLRHLNYIKWFDRIGMILLFSSLVMFLAMMIAPISIAPYVGGKQYILNFNIIYIIPSLFLYIGVLWLIEWADKKEFNINFIVFNSMVLSAIIMLQFKDITNLAVIEVLFFSILLQRNSLNRIFIGIFVLLILGYVVVSYVEYFPQFNLLFPNIGTIDNPKWEFGQIITNLGWSVFFILICAYGWLLYHINKIGNSLFIKGIISLVAIDILLNILCTFSIFSFTPPSLYLIEYSHSGIITFFIMIGMAMMQRDIAS